MAIYIRKLPLVMGALEPTQGLNCVGINQLINHIKYTDKKLSEKCGGGGVSKSKDEQLKAEASKAIYHMTVHCHSTCNYILLEVKMKHWSIHHNEIQLDVTGQLIIQYNRDN